MKIFNYQVNKTYGKIVDDISANEITDKIKLSFELPAIFINEKELYCNIQLADCQRNLKLPKPIEGSCIRVIEIPSEFLKEGELKIALTSLKYNRQKNKMVNVKTIPCESLNLFKTKIDNQGLVSVVPELQKLKEELKLVKAGVIEALEYKENNGGIL